MTAVEQPTSGDWAGSRGARWLRDLDSLEAMLAPVGEGLIARAALGAGESVVDIGSGGGWTSARAAEAVGPGGRVLGLDISADLVAEAGRRHAGLPQLAFRAGDAAGKAPPEAPFDRLISRFGVMFFADPAAAWIQLGRLLHPGGRIDVAVWADPKKNPWASELRAVVARHVEVPKPDPLAPGPFQLADEGYFDGVLAGAGFVGIERELVSRPLLVGGAGSTAASAAAFALQAFGAGEALEGAPADTVAAAAADLEGIYAAHETPDGVAVAGAWWLVSARLG